MTRLRILALANVAGFCLFVSTSRAQSDDPDVYWHIDPGVKTCSMVIDPALTQAQWHTFTEQAGPIMSFKSLASPATLGKMRFVVAIDYDATPVDQHDPAWINTFTHPDASCPLGDKIHVPTIRARMGVSDRMDVGAYWTTAPGVNYGGVGGELKYGLLQASGNGPVAAVRGSVSLLTGVPDFNMGVYSLDVMAGEKIAGFVPYVGYRQNLVIATETTPKVDLERETRWLPQGFAGVTYSLRRFNFTAEYSVSTVNTLAFAIGVGRLGR